MKLESVGILIGLRPFEERDFIATVFTLDYGILKGMIRGGQIAKKNRPLIGQFGNISWNARLDSQLGVFHFESEKNLIVDSMCFSDKLVVINAAFSLLASLLPERERYEDLFEKTKILLISLPGLNPQKSKYIYLNWESDLLRALGYSLNLGACSNCGSLHNLNYLSPKTGRAVCDNCAVPYINRLFKLPLTLDTTKKFFEKICDQHDTKLPIERQILI